MLFITLFVTLQMSVSLKEETGCGCDISRPGERKLNQENVLISKINNELQYCEDKTCSDAEKENMEPAVVLVLAGEYQLGTDDIAIKNDKEGPKRMIKLNSFYLDKYEVSNKDFHNFITSTKYKTEAEQYGDSFVFSAFLNSTFKEQLKDFRAVQAVWWYKVSGADWRHPYGPDSDIQDQMDHPVVHVSWKDAKEYCKWRDARLPTEAEWEAGCRGGNQNTKYPWGDKLFPDRKYMANIWQGTFPSHNSAKDGYVGTNPVHMFPPNDFGLHNMAGNVWEWTEDSWSADNPKEKVKKGGSYLCHQSYCYRYRCSARSHNTDDSSSGNLGFRCAKSV